MARREIIEMHPVTVTAIRCEECDRTLGTEHVRATVAGKRNSYALDWCNESCRVQWESAHSIWGEGYS